MTHPNNAHKVYTVCDVCNKPLSPEETKLGVANHETCWKAWADERRHKMIPQAHASIFENPVCTTPIYDENGVRYRERLEELTR